MLADLLKQFRSDPVIKRAMQKDLVEDQEPVYARVRAFMANPAFAAFVTEVCKTNNQCLTGQLKPGTWINYGGKEPFETCTIQELCKEINQKMTRAVRAKPSPTARKQLISWVHNNTRNAYLYDDVVAELRFMEGIHPTEPVTLYRGLMFGKWQLKNPTKMPSMGGGDHPKSARIFVNALRHGHSELMLDLSEPSSWTQSPDIAHRFASKNASGSEYGAMMNWLHNAGRKIDGELGIVISATFQPRDIVCDVSKIDLGHLAHGHEGEMIIASGPHRVKIERILTPAGEIEVAKFVEFIQGWEEKHLNDGKRI